MGQKILVDTNIAIGYLGSRLSLQSMDKLNQFFDGEYHLSVINKIELLGYPELDQNEEEKFNLLIEYSVLHQIGDKIIEKTISIRKKQRIKHPDALIAATCIVNGLKLLTLNTKDFENIPGLRVIQPETM